MSASIALVGGAAALVVGGVLAACSALEAENRRKARESEAAAKRAEKAIGMAQENMRRYESCCAKEEIVDQLGAIVDEYMAQCDQLEQLCNSEEENLASIQEQIDQAARCLEMEKMELAKTFQGSEKNSAIRKVINDYESFIQNQKEIQEEQEEQLDRHAETLNDAKAELNKFFHQYMDATVEWFGECKDYGEAVLAQYEQLMGKS